MGGGSLFLNVVGMRHDLPMHTPTLHLSRSLPRNHLKTWQGGGQERVLQSSFLERTTR